MNDGSEYMDQIEFTLEELFAALQKDALKKKISSENLEKITKIVKMAYRSGYASAEMDAY